MAETIKVAAKWWADRIRNRPAFFDNGDDSMTGRMTGMMAGLVAQKREYDEVTIQRFENMLAEKINQEIEEIGKATLHCDYNPDRLLRDAALESGLLEQHEISSNATFPWKTTMEVTKVEVRVKNGYGQPLVKLPL